MLCSIVIPFYNDSKFLGRLETSLTDYINDQDFEIIIVDDCSQINEYQELIDWVTIKNFKSVRVVRNSSNRGPSFSRNRGVQEASGKYIAFLDSDDGWSHRRLYRIIPLLERSGIDVCGGHCIQATESDFNSIRGNDVNYRLSRVTSAKAMFSNPFSTPSVVVRSSLAKSTPFDETLRYSEDFNCWLTMLDKANGFILCDSGAYMFKHSYVTSTNSLSSNTIKMSIGELKSLRNFNLKSDNYIVGFLLVPAVFWSVFKSAVRVVRMALYRLISSLK